MLKEMKGVSGISPKMLDRMEWGGGGGVIAEEVLFIKNRLNCMMYLILILMSWFKTKI